MERVDSVNQRPFVPDANDRVFPDVVPLRQYVAPKHDTRLRLFSGTANPALSQVILASSVPLRLKLLKFYHVMNIWQ